MAQLLDPEQLAWMTSGRVSILVASRSAENQPSLGHGLGCRLDPDGRRVTVLLLEGYGPEVLLDLRAGRDCSLLFTQSITTRSLQLKARHAIERPVAATDEALLDACTDTLALEWGAAGLPEAIARALMARKGALVAFEIEWEAAFDQTPGPQAGASLVGSRG